MSLINIQGIKAFLIEDVDQETEPLDSSLLSRWSKCTDIRTFFSISQVLQTESVQPPEAWPLSLQRLVRLLHPGFCSWKLCFQNNCKIQVALTSRCLLVWNFVCIIIPKSRSFSLGRESLPNKSVLCLSQVRQTFWFNRGLFLEFNSPLCSGNLCPNTRLICLLPCLVALVIVFVFVIYKSVSSSIFWPINSSRACSSTLCKKV